MIMLGEVAIMGGGCYGRFYAEQLHRAWDQGILQWQQLHIVDQDPACAAAALLAAIPKSRHVCTSWDDFLDAWLDPASRHDADRLVPTPLMPHLFADWLTRRAQALWPEHRVMREPLDEAIGTPYDRLHPGDGNRYISHADWLCPVHCIEPARCPKIRAPRQWEMSETLTEWNRGRIGGPATLALFRCQHVAFGVGMVEVPALLDAVARLRATMESHGAAEVVIGSISSCHGAVGRLRVTPS